MGCMSIYDDSFLTLVISRERGPARIIRLSKPVVLGLAVAAASVFGGAGYLAVKTGRQAAQIAALERGQPAAAAVDDVKRPAATAQEAPRSVDLAAGEGTSAVTTAPA